MDLVLALSNRTEPQAVRFLFNIFDTYNCGELSIDALEHYFNSLGEQKWGEFEDFYSEMYDLIKPRDSNCITLNDLLKS